MNKRQWRFLLDLSNLIQHAATLDGVMLTGGDLYQDNDWHRLNSYGTPHLQTGQHPKRLAIDLNLFVDGTYVRGDHEVWHELGPFWKSLNPDNRWGGDFTKRDYNHFEG